MGKRLNLCCDCGYQKDIFVGEGLMAINLPKIRKLFAGMDLSDFERAVAGGADYAMGNRIVHCASCNSLASGAVLRYAEDEATKMLIKPCSDCGGEVTLRESAGDCPKCGMPLRSQETGLWD
jgi:hypothetical protein